MIRLFLSYLPRVSAARFRKILFFFLIAGAIGFVLPPLVFEPKNLVIGPQGELRFDIAPEDVQQYNHSFKGRSVFQTQTGILKQEDLEKAQTALREKLVADIMTAEKKEGIVKGIVENSIVSHFQDSEPPIGTGTKTFELGLQGEITIAEIEKKNLPIKNPSLRETILSNSQLFFSQSLHQVTIVLTSASGR